MNCDMAMVDFKEGKSVRHGKTLRRTYFCGIIDDSSRILVGYEWGFYQDTTLFAKTFKKAVSIYGIPKILYCDQAKVFRSQYIMQICARLGISLVNAPPYSPESKAKIERFNRTIQQIFYPLIKNFHAIDIDQLNQLFDKFIREIYHIKPHAGLENSESPLKKLHRLFLFDHDKLCKELKPVDLVGNANAPHVSTSYSKLSNFPKKEKGK